MIGRPVRRVVWIALALVVMAAVALGVGRYAGFRAGGFAVFRYLAQEARVAVLGEDARSRAAVDSLCAAFNREREHARLVAVLSPT
jgi:hypothetical protein